MHQTKRELPHQTSNLTNPTAHLRKSGVDFPLNEGPKVKNHKVNAQLAPIDYNSERGMVHMASYLPPAMSREELMSLEKNPKNVSIENLLNVENMTRGGKNLAPLAPLKKKM